jgi:hypothetical protein
MAVMIRGSWIAGPPFLSCSIKRIRTKIRIVFPQDDGFISWKRDKPILRLSSSSVLFVLHPYGINNNQNF